MYAPLLRKLLLETGRIERPSKVKEELKLVDFRSVYKMESNDGSPYIYLSDAIFECLCGKQFMVAHLGLYLHRKTLIHCDWCWTESEVFLSIIPISCPSWENTY